MADVNWLPARGFPRGAQLGAECLHARGDHPGAQLRHNSRDAPEQASIPQARGLHNDGGLAVRSGHGDDAPLRYLRLPQIRHLPALRDDKSHVPRLRRLPHAHQRRGFLHPDGLLPEDVLRYKGLAGLELERLAYRQEDGAPSVHRFYLLVADRFLLAYGGVRPAVGQFGAGEGIRRVRAAAQLLLQSVSLRDTDQTVQEGLRDDLQGDRGEQSHEGHREVQAQLEFQQ